MGLLKGSPERHPRESWHKTDLHLMEHKPQTKKRPPPTPNHQLPTTNHPTTTTTTTTTEPTTTEPTTTTTATTTTTTTTPSNFCRASSICTLKFFTSSKINAACCHAEAFSQALNVALYVTTSTAVMVFNKLRAIVQAAAFLSGPSHWQFQFSAMPLFTQFRKTMFNSTNYKNVKQEIRTCTLGCCFLQNTIVKVR